MNLAEHGISPPSFAVGDYKLKCPKCRDTRKSKNKHDTPLSLTINPDGSAVWKCHNCEWSGGTGFSNSSYEPPAPIYRAPREPKIKNKSDDMIEWFGKRGITESTLDAFGIYKTQKSFGGSPQGCIVFPYYLDGVLVNAKYRTRDKQFRQENGAKRTLFNIDRVKKQFDGGVQEVVIVEGEMDVLSLHEVGIIATTLPDGAPQKARYNENDKRFNALSEHEWLMDAQKITIATDGDDAGKALALELVHRFGKDRCFRVQWPDDCKDANEYLLSKGKDSLISLIQDASPYPIDGLYAVANYKAQVQNIYDGLVEQPLGTGWEMMDQIYKVMPSTFHVVTGVPNHGKSNWLDQLTVQMAWTHGWKFAIFSPEHSTSQHLRRLTEKVVQKPFDKGPNPRMSQEELDDAMNFLDERFYFIESQDEIPTIDWLLNKARAACLRFGVRGIVIDPYNEISANRDANKREDEHIRDLISKCKQFCRRHDVTMWMVAHPAKMPRDQDGNINVPTLYDISGAAHWNNMADVGLVVHRDFERGLTRVVVRKVREQGLYGNIGECFFKYGLDTHHYVEHDPDKEPIIRYRRDIHD